jgi:hypothetical protein
MAYARANTIQTVRDYVSRMCTDVAGMKVLVMDAETTGIVSMVFTQTQVLQHEVFITDTIERQRSEKMPHLKVSPLHRPVGFGLGARGVWFGCACVNPGAAPAGGMPALRRVVELGGCGQSPVRSGAVSRAGLLNEPGAVPAGFSPPPPTFLHALYP